MKNTTHGNLAHEKGELRQRDRARYMADIEVPADEWEQFLQSFSDQHEGWLVNVFTSAAGKKYEKFPQVIGRNLKRICIDQKDVPPKVHIAVDAWGESLIYSVPDPTRLTLKQDSEGAHEGLDIGSSDGSVTSLRFRVPARPETLDGILGMRQNAYESCADCNLPVTRV